MSSNPAPDAVAVTPSDSVDITGDPPRALYIGGTGDVAVVTSAGTVVLFAAVPTGTILPVRAKRVNSTNTTATAIVALR